MARLTTITDEEWQNRVDLAACYHLADHFNMSDIIWNHITAKTCSQKDTFLINKFGLRYDEVTASNLLEIDLDGAPLWKVWVLHIVLLVRFGKLLREQSPE